MKIGIMQRRVFSNNYFGQNQTSKKFLCEFEIIKKIGFCFIKNINKLIPLRRKAKENEYNELVLIYIVILHHI